MTLLHEKTYQTDLYFHMVKKSNQILKRLWSNNNLIFSLGSRTCFQFDFISNGFLLSQRIGNEYENSVRVNNDEKVSSKFMRGKNYSKYTQRCPLECFQTENDF